VKKFAEASNAEV